MNEVGMASTIVMKFGGTSVGTIDAMHASVKIIQEARKNWDQVVVVTSALSGVTDVLLNQASSAANGDTSGLGAAAADLRTRHTTILDQLVPSVADRTTCVAAINSLLDQFVSLCQAVSILGEATPRALDAIASLGERCSVQVLAACLNSVGTPAAVVDASQLIVTDSRFQSAVPEMVSTREKSLSVLTPLLEQRIVPIITGFIGATPAGIVTTLGRGGSDFTAAILGVSLSADEVWIWTDVNGVMTADPRIIANAKTIPLLSFREISELAYFGAKVLHPKTIRPVVEAGITLKVLNTFNPRHAGTSIVNDSAVENGNVIKAVTVIKELKLVTLEGRGMLGVPGVAARTFSAIAATHTSVPLISQASSEQSICFAVPSASASKVINALQVEFEREFSRRDIDSVWATEEVIIISVVGAGMRNTPGIAGRVFSVLGHENVNVIAIAQGSSEVSISFITSAEDGTKAIQALHTLIN